ncbi:MAG: urea transporter [Muribaculaceae bacterium]|nr:urea transporter [Muribaculaceae bacterium]
METKKIIQAVTATLNGSGQVMFQQSPWTGLLFLAGIFWGSYECHMPQVAWGALVGLVASTVAGLFTEKARAATAGAQGLWGFNGILVGCAFPTFLSDTWQMWLALIFCAMLSTWVRTGLNNVMAPWKINSLTFPFVLLTWIFLFASRMMDGMAPAALSDPALTEHFSSAVDTSFGSLVVYWLKGVAQVFLVNSWVTGIFFLVALAVCSRWAALWGAVGSAVALAVALLFKADGSDIANGLFGFSPVLTGIAIGCTFNKPGLRSAVWAVVAIVATVFVQAGMDMFFEPFGLPTLTGPFCLTTWLFILPLYKFSTPQEKHSEWDSEWDNFVGDLRRDEKKFTDSK